MTRPLLSFACCLIAVTQTIGTADASPLHRKPALVVRQPFVPGPIVRDIPRLERRSLPNIIVQRARTNVPPAGDITRQMQRLSGPAPKHDSRPILPIRQSLPPQPTQRAVVRPPERIDTSPPTIRLLPSSPTARPVIARWPLPRPSAIPSIETGRALPREPQRLVVPHAAALPDADTVRRSYRPPDDDSARVRRDGGTVTDGRKAAVDRGAGKAARHSIDNGANVVDDGDGNTTTGIVVTPEPRLPPK